jgi:hypothetical protein
LGWALNDDDAGDGGERRTNEFAEKKKRKRKKRGKEAIFQNGQMKIIKSSFSIEIILLQATSALLHLVLSILSFCKWLDKHLSPIDLNTLQHIVNF